MPRRKPQKDTRPFLDPANKRVYYFKAKRLLTSEEQVRALSDHSRHTPGQGAAYIGIEECAVIWVNTNGLGNDL